MSEEILINVTPRETRVALVENGMLQELHVERSSRRGYVGNVYKGKVCREMAGMQGAFVEVDAMDPKGGDGLGRRGRTFNVMVDVLRQREREHERELRH